MIKPSRWAALALVLTASSAFAQDLVLKNARVETGKSVFNSATIVIRNGRIEAVGPDVSAPSGVTAMDCQGKTIYPGFLDGYRTGGLKLPEPPAPGTPPSAVNTAPATMWEKNRRGIRSELVASELIDPANLVSGSHRSGLTLALMSGGSGSLRGWTCAVHLVEGKEVHTPKIAHEFAFRAAGAGGPGGGGQGGGYPGSLMGVIALMRQTMYDALRYRGEPEDKALASLQPTLTGLARSLFYANTANEVERSLRMADEFNLKLTLAGAREAQNHREQLVARQIPVLVSVAIGDAPAASGTADGPPESVRQERIRDWENRAKNVSRLLEAGVKIGFTTDGDPVADYLANVRKVMKHGVSRDAALKAMTSGVAEILGLTDLGFIEAGKTANLTIMDGDFADDKSKVTHVVIKGKLIELKKEQM